MKTIATKKRIFCSKKHYLFLVFLLFAAFTVEAQFQIVGMQYNGQYATTVNLTILTPKGSPYNGPVNADPNKLYNSGTTFKTPANTSISILCKGQKQIMEPNSTLKLTLVNNGIKAQTITGTVKHILDNVKGNLSFYVAGNGYTWAHAQGTVFDVQAYDKSKKVKFSTEEGTIAIIEDVPVSIDEAAKNQINRSGKAKERELSTSQKTLNSAGQEYISENVQPIEYATYEEALAAFDDETYSRNEAVDPNNPDWALVAELADDFALLGGLYLENGQPEMAIEPLQIAVYYYGLTDPEGFMTLESFLYLSEALIMSDDEENRNEGENKVGIVLEVLEEVLDEDIKELNYAIATGDDDYAWEISQELVDICEYFGWSYDLLGQTEIADQYYDWVDRYSQD
ncbi:MAG: hypothetical protein WBA61_15210 [Aequorivita sp.]